MTPLDWCALAVVACAAVLGLRKGLVAGGLALAGVAVGAVVGSRLAPALLSDGEPSPYTPLVALVGACVGALLLETVGSLAGGALRRSLRLTPLAPLDLVGGLVLGAAAGVAAVWMAGAVAAPRAGAVRAPAGPSSSRRCSRG